MPDIANITFAIDREGNVNLERVPDNRTVNGLIQVAQGTRPNVIFRNDGNNPVTVQVGRAPGSGSGPAPDLERLFGGDPPDFGGGRTVFNVNPGQQKKARIGSFPDPATYLLSTGANRTNGTLVVHRVTLYISNSSGRATIAGGGGNLAVMQGVPLPVEFVNLIGRSITVYTEGLPADGHPKPKPETLFVANDTVSRDSSERPVISLMPKGTPGDVRTATISATAELGNFNFGIQPPPFPDTGSCVIHVHM